MTEEKNKIPRFIVIDIIFEAQSLNYDQGIGVYQELKKIHRGDGKVYTLVSRYALRYSILEQGKDRFGWKLADREVLIRAGQDKKVLQPDPKKLSKLLDYDDLNFFGFLITDINIKGEEEGKEKKREKREKEEETTPIAVPAPVKLTHAISMEPFKFDSHFNVNLALARRYDPTQPGSYQNPFQVEEHRSYYKYSVVIDVHRLTNGVEWFISNEETAEKLKNLGVEIKEDRKRKYVRLEPPQEIKEKIGQLIEVIFNLHRSIKGRSEDLSPTLAIVGIYDNDYYSFLNDLELVSEAKRITEIEEMEEDGKRKIIVKEKELNGVCFGIKNLSEVKERIQNLLIYTKSKELLDSNFLKKIEEFLEEKGKKEKGQKVEPQPKQPEKKEEIKLIIEDKNEVIQKIHEKLGLNSKKGTPV